MAPVPPDNSLQVRVLDIDTGKAITYLQVWWDGGKMHRTPNASTKIATFEDIPAGKIKVSAGKNTKHPLVTEEVEMPKKGPKQHTLKVKLQPEIILTFDDGPLYGTKEKRTAVSSILASLKTYQAKGVFYLLGEEVKQDPGAAKLIVDAGHFVENHSWDHPKFGTLSKEKMIDQLKRTQDVIGEATGEIPSRFRPPYGHGKGLPQLAEAASAVGLKLTYWDIDTNDWMNPKGLTSRRFSPQRTSWRAKIDAMGGVPLDLLMHCQNETARDLPGLLSELKGERWAFVTYPD